MHPFQDKRAHKVEHARVPRMTQGYAAGGAVGAPSEAGGPVSRKAAKMRDGQAVETVVQGTPARARMDKTMRARGGRTKHKGTHVNVIVAPQGGAAAPPAMAGVAPPPPAAMPPRPAMVPQAPMAGPPPGMPPGIRSYGGRAYASGGAVSGPAWNEGIKAGTPVQHTNNKLDGHNIGRGKQITYKRGGRVKAYKTGGKINADPPIASIAGTKNRIEAPGPGKAMALKLPGGGGGGKARLAKSKIKRDGYRL